MSINTVIFDLDGTLLYTLDALRDSVNYMLNHFGYPEKTLDEVRNSVGNGVPILIERVLPDGVFNPKYNEALKLFKKHYSDNILDKTSPYDGVVELLKALKEKKYTIAVVSNKFDSAVKTLCSYFFKDLVDAAEGQRENVSPKPSPDLVMSVVDKLGINLQSCIFIGDSEVDILTADNVGIPCISVAWGYKSINFLYSNGAQTIIYSPEELLELI